MKLDSNLAWKETVAMIAANREALYAIAGVFFLLPNLAFSLLFPQPQNTAGLSREETFALAQTYYAASVPYLIPVMVIQLAGVLAILTLFTDRDRPTVGEAIRRGFRGVPTYLGGLLIFSFAVAIGLLFVGLLGAAAGSSGLAALLTFLIGVFVVYGWIRLSQLPPVIAVERIYNPLAALRRSWALTRGNVARILLFVALLLIAFFVVGSVVMLLVGTLLALIVGGEVAQTIAAVVWSALVAVFLLYLFATFGAIHRQLSLATDERQTPG